MSTFTDNTDAIASEIIRYPGMIKRTCSFTYVQSGCEYVISCTDCAISLTRDGVTLDEAAWLAMSAPDQATIITELNNMLGYVP